MSEQFSFPLSPENLTAIINSFPEPIKSALEILVHFGQEDGDHHKAWAIDQAVRRLTGDKYDALIEAYQEPVPEDYEMYYEWDTGIAP